MPRVFTRAMKDSRDANRTRAASPFVAPTPDERVEGLQASEQRDFKEYRDAAGVLRVRVGKQTDGKYGLRVWTSAGALSVDQTTT